MASVRRQVAPTFPARRRESGSVKLLPDSPLTSHVALVVEDDHDFAAELVGILAAEGWSAASTSEGAAAVDHVRERCPDLVLLDLMLPDIDGVDVLRQIRAFSDAYVLVVSRRDGEQSKVDALRAGADDYLTRPASMPGNSRPAWRL